MKALVARTVLDASKPTHPTCMTALLSVRDVTVRFRGIVALDKVAFDVERGQIAGLIGPNGAGKTTLFNCLSRLYEYSEGSILFDGQAIETMPRHEMARIGIGRTFQNLALYKTMSVLDNIKVGYHCRAAKGFLAHALRLPGVAAEEADITVRAQRLVACRRSRIIGSATCRSARKSASNSGARWPASRNFCCLMSPLRASITKNCMHSVT